MHKQQDCLWVLQILEKYIYKQIPKEKEVTMKRFTKHLPLEDEPDSLLELLRLLHLLFLWAASFTIFTAG